MCSVSSARPRGLPRCPRACCTVKLRHQPRRRLASTRHRSSRIRRAISAPALHRSPIPIPTSSPSIRRSTRCVWATPPSSGSGPAGTGGRGPPGRARDAISSGATSPTTARCATSKTTGASRCSARRRTTATATRSISGATDLVRARRAPGRPLRARRLGHRHRRRLSRASG